MIPLPAAAVVEDARPAVRVTDADEPRGNLADRRLPVDGLERAVRPPSQRRRQSVASVLVVVEPLRLLTRVAARPGMGAVAADTGNVPVVELHLDPAVDAAQDARRLSPLVAHTLLRSSRELESSTRE